VTSKTSGKQTKGVDMLQDLFFNECCYLAEIIFYMHDFICPTNFQRWGLFLLFLLISKNDAFIAFNIKISPYLQDQDFFN
jgi:hypothetical protein